MTQSFHDEAVKEVLRDFAASVLQVPESAYEDEEESILAMTPESYEMPNGYNHKFGAERFQLVEGLFNPSLIKVKRSFIVHVIISSFWNIIDLFEGIFSIWLTM